MNRQLLHRLGGIFDTHQILASDLYREIYSRDGSYFDIKPEVIVRPDTPQQVQQLLAIASEAGVNVTFRTGGTSLSGQSVNEGIICELRTAWKKSEVRDHGRKIWFEPDRSSDQYDIEKIPDKNRAGSCFGYSGYDGGNTFEQQ